MDLTTPFPGPQIHDGAWSAALSASYKPRVWPAEPPDTPASFRFVPSPGDVILRMTKQVALVRRRGAPVEVAPAQPGHTQSCVLIGFHRTPLRLAIDGCASEIMTPNHLSLQAPGSVCSLQPLGEEGEASDYIALSPLLLRRIRATLGIDAGASDEALFPHSFAPSTPAAFLAQRRLFALALERTGIDSRAIEDAVCAIVSEALHSAQRQAEALRSARNFHHLRPLVEQAKALLAGEYLTELPLEQLARRLRCSRGHLSRAFHALTGYRPVEYRNELRLRHGLTMMEEFGSSSEDIAAKMNFVNRSHFSRTVRKRFGITPTEYVRSLSGNRAALKRTAQAEGA